MMLLLALFAPWAANAQVTIGDLETATNDSYLPMNSLYDYSYTQQIYTADEIGTAGTINSITVWLYGNADLYEMPFDIYMVETDKENFTSTTDWVSVTSGDIVYSGSVTVHNTAAEAYTFTLPVPFTYSGTSNLLIAFDNNTGQWKSGLNGKVFTAEDAVVRAIYARRDGTDYDPTNMAGISANGTTAKRNVIEIDITPTGGGPTCARPSNLDVADITGFGATCTWENTGAASYTFEWKKASASDWTVVSGLTANTYALSSLESMTAYNVRVKAVCDTDLESTYKTANFTTLEVCPDGKVCIGQGTATNNYLPTNNYYNYSLTEQIYTAEEIGAGGTVAIESVDIYSVGSATRTLEIYMVSTEKRNFENGNDWIAATATDLVFNGSATFAANSWNTFEFDNPFIYDGTSNVALIIRDMTGDYVSSIPFFVFEADGQAIYAYRDGSAYDLTNPGVSGTVLNVKNRVRLVIGEPPACPKPTGLTVNYEGGTEATISWTSDATAWNMRVNGTEINGTITNPYTLTGLELATTYEVEVQANCGDNGVSEWTNPVSFTTDKCMPEDQCALTFVVTDSYGDGWNGASIDVYDYTGGEVGELLASIANQNLDGLSGSTQTELETQTITLNFCNGQELAIFWTSGNYDSEVSYTVTDLNGDVVVEGSGEGFDAFAYTMNCTVTDCRKPSDFAASEITGHSVVLSWTENGPATEWVIEYLSENDTVTTTITVNTNPYTLTGLTPETAYAAQVTPVCEVDKPSEAIYFTTDVACPKPYNMNVTPYAYTANVEWNGYAEAYEIEWVEMPASKDPYNEEGWYYYDNGTYAGSVGLGGGEFHWGIMLPAGSFEGTTIDIVKAYDINAMVGTLAIYNDGETAPDNQLSIQNIEFTGAGEWVEFNTGGVTVDPSKNVWIVFDAVDGAAYPMGTSSDDNGDANGRWVEISGTWYDLATVGVEGRANMIRAHFVSFNYDDLDWTTVSGITSPYLIEGLQPETQYIVRVKALCGGEDGESGWTYAYFTTPSACDMPINLVAEDITYNSATLNWTGYQESFNVKYRQVPHGEVYASANFDDNSMGEWTTIDADGDGYDWVLGSECGGIYLAEGSSLAGTGHNGSADMVTSGSYSNATSAALTPDNYLVSPQVTLGGTITFWACGQDASYAAEHFVVAVSTTGNTDAADFTTIQEWTMTAKGGNRGNVSKLVVGGGAKTEPAATTRSGNRAQGTWYQFTVDLSEYSGQGYVAIRHFDCTDMFMLDVDDIVIEGVAPTIEWTTVTVTEPTLALTGLTPETEYEWQVQGINASCGELEWTEIQTFTTLEQTTVTQTLELAEGWNWVSIYVTNDDPVELLLALEEAIGENGLEIQAKNDGMTEFDGEEWFGDLDETGIFNDQTYLINIENGCSVQLTGIPADLESYSIEINPGWNWIGFPSYMELDIAEALRDFEAEEEDQLQSQEGITEFDGEEWFGDMETLQPGKGFMYFSNSEETKYLVFRSAAKARKARP